MPLSVTALIFSVASVEVNVIASPASGLPFAVTVAVAVLVDVPSAAIEAGESETAIVFAGQVIGAVYVLLPAPMLVHRDWVPP